MDVYHTVFLHMSQGKHPDGHDAMTGFSWLHQVLGRSRSCSSCNGEFTGTTTEVLINLKCVCVEGMNENIQFLQSIIYNYTDIYILF